MKTAACAGRLSVGWFVGALLLGVSGCGEELGPVPMPTAPVSGRVTSLGQPLSRGWLEFMPVDGTVGRLRSARIASDGTFRDDRVAEGLVAIRIVGANLPPAEAALFSQRYLIRRAIRPGGTTDLEIDLDRERRSIAPTRSR